MFSKIFNVRTFTTALFYLFALSAAYSAISIARTPMAAPLGDPASRTGGDYISLLLASLSGCAALAPALKSAARSLRPGVSSVMLVIFAGFLFCALYLGEFKSFYYKFPWWDTALHTFSGVMLGAFGFMIITLLNDSDSVPVQLSPFFAAVFAFCFAVALGALWEIFEFTTDSLYHTNMQRYMLADGTQLVGQKALFDTMKDLIVDTAGALFISIIGYTLLFRKGLIEKIQIHNNREKQAEVRKIIRR